MRKLLRIRNPKEFWKIFSRERKRILKKQRRLPFLAKLKILEKMDEMDIRGPR